MRSSFTGFTALTPSGRPSREAAWSWDAVGFRCSRSRNSFTSAAVPPRSARDVTSSCSGAKTKNVTPHSVSGRVVNTVTSSPVSSMRNVTSAPSERPIQFRCWVSTRSVQPSSSCAMSSSRRSA